MFISLKFHKTEPIGIIHMRRITGANGNVWYVGIPQKRRNGN